MIISKTPLRISFFGGGTDYPEYFEENGGAVFGMAIDKYVYVTVKKLHDFFNIKYKLSYSKTEQINDISSIEHPAIRSCLKYLGIYDPLESHIISDWPARTGLGSSSSFTVGLLKALH